MTRFRNWSAVWLGVTLGLAILLRWIDGAWINPSLFQAGLFSLVGLWCARFVLRPYAVLGSFGLIPLAGALAWGLIQLGTGHTVSRWDTWNATLAWAGNLAAFWLALQICSDTKVRQTLLRGMTVFAFALSVVSLLQFISAPTRMLWFYETGYAQFGPLGNRDRFAEFGELMIPVAAVQGMRGGRVNWFYAGAAATLFAAVIAGMSRAGGALVVMEAVALGMLLGGRRLGGPLATLGVMVCVFTAVVGVEGLLERYRAPDPYAGRREFLESAVAMVRDRPGMGFGLGNFENAYPAYARVDMDKVINHAHNDWAEWAVDGGVPFLALMVALGVWFAPRAVRSVWGIGVLAVLAHATMDFPLQSPALASWVFVLMGAIAAERKQVGATPHADRGL